MTSEAPVSITAPTLPEPPAPYSFPLVATLAPILVSAIAWAVTRSALALVFAALGPMIALGSLLDARLQSRRRRRREGARFVRELESARSEVTAALEAQRARREAEHPGSPAAPRWTGPPADPLWLRLGTGVVPSGVRLEGVPSASRSPTAEAMLVERLARECADLESAPVIVDAREGVGIVGRPLPTVALARALVLRLAAALSPADGVLRVRGAGDWDWLLALPHTVELTRGAGPPVLSFSSGSAHVVLALARTRNALPGGLGTIVELDGDRLESPERLSAEEARIAAEACAAAARELGVLPARSRLPSTVALSALEQPAHGLAAAIGAGEDGAVSIDLVADGPHAIVGGTTGSGKSELLISWLLALATRRSPDSVTMLLVDFKGGSAFGALRGLPHCVGVVTDLDDDTAQRALESLAAELRYRERVLAEAGARSIEQSASLVRLLIVVDEYAAVAQGCPQLHALFSDLAARGRSLGIHLVLCTQRPAGVVRDAVLANAGLRISLRVNNGADSSAVIGVDDAARLPASAVGRALLSAHGETPVPVQLALATPADVERVRALWSSRDWNPRRPWCDPLPQRLELAELAAVPGEGIPFGLADRPEQQSQPVARWLPREHGNLLVVGASGAGKTGALDCLAAGSAGATRLSARSPEAAWDVVTELLDGIRGGVRGGGTLPTIVLVDDLDALLGRLGEEHRGEFADRLGALLREGPAQAVHTVFSVQRVSGQVASLAPLAGARLLLRLPDRQEHVLAGGAGEAFRERLPPGGGLWQGRRVQVALAPLGAPEPPPRVSGFDPSTEPLLGVVSGRPDETLAILLACGVAPDAVLRPGAGAGEAVQVGVGEPRRVLLADPHGWQASWGAIEGLQGRAPILFDGCTVSDYRALTRDRRLPPPLGSPSGDPSTRAMWLLAPDGDVRRVRLGAR